MGNTISSWGGRKRVQSIINSAGLPLQIDSEDATGEEDKGPLSPFTEAYPAAGWFTGCRSTVTIAKPPAVVYKSLSKDLHKIFSPMTECEDEIEEDNGKGVQVLFRVVRIPFKVAFVTGNLKLRLHVEQDSQTGKIHFESVKEGRLITRFVADFDISPKEGELGHTVVKLDSKISAKQLPPPPFKGMVKDVMVRKMDSCMVDLVQFHSTPEGEKHEVEVDATLQSQMARKPSQGLLATLRKSFSSGRPASMEKQQSVGWQKSMDRRKSMDKLRQKSRDWQRSLSRRFSMEDRKSQAAIAGI